MQLTRRAALAAAIAASMRPKLAAPESRGADDLGARLDTDLRQHAQFGDKVTGSAGDQRTADWIAERLARIGFAVEQPRFGAPFFTMRRSVLAVGGESVDVIPQPIVVPTGPDGITAPVAIMREVEDALDARGCIALIVLPFGRWAALWSSPIAARIKASDQFGRKGGRHRHDGTFCRSRNAQHTCHGTVRRIARRHSGSQERPSHSGRGTQPRALNPHPRRQ